MVSLVGMSRCRQGALRQSWFINLGEIQGRQDEGRPLTKFLRPAVLSKLCATPSSTGRLASDGSIHGGYLFVSKIAMPASPAPPLEAYRLELVSAAEEMGATLEHAAFSANIKERRDYSCAIFSATGDLLAQAAHIPVHLGSQSESVRAVLRSGLVKPGNRWC